MGYNIIYMYNVCIYIYAYIGYDSFHQTELTYLEDMLIHFTKINLISTAEPLHDTARHQIHGGLQGATEPLFVAQGVGKS